MKHDTSGANSFPSGAITSIGKRATRWMRLGARFLPPSIGLALVVAVTASMLSARHVGPTPIAMSTPVKDVSVTPPTPRDEASAPLAVGRCVITCAANITVSNFPNQCGAVVSYPAPTTTGTCGTITCTPPSGSFFPVGTTTVTCTDSGGATCTHTITVNDTQPPAITCPANMTVVSTPSAPCSVVNFTVTASDNCPGVTVVANPPSGSCFPLGTTTVTATATDASGNTATCSFTVTLFDVCVQDDSNAATVLEWNSISGDYRFCCNGTIYTGKGTVTKQGSIYTLVHNPVDRRVLGKIDTTQKRGSGSIQSPPGTIRCTIMDRDTTNNACQCP